MKNIGILRISILVIIISSSVIGCAITYSMAPHAALARILIDIGALIALTWITYSLPKPEAIQIDDIVDGLRDLAKNRFDRRLTVRDQDQLFQVRQAFNELAGTLSDSRDSSLTHIRYNPMHRIEPKVIPLPMIHHSLHPELGQVKVAIDEELSKPDLEIPQDLQQQSAQEYNLHEIEPFDSGTILQQSEDFELPSASAEPLTELTSALTNETEHIVEAPLMAQNEPKPVRPEAYPSDIGAADFFFLFEKFKAAHDQIDQSNIGFDDFMTTVQRTREDLIRSHHCKDVKFDVVNSDGAVALRPRLIR